MYVYDWKFSGMLRVMMLCTASASNLYLLPVCGATNIAFLNLTLIDICSLVRSYDGSHMKVQCHWLQKSFPNGQRAQFTIFTIVLLIPIWVESHRWSSLLLLSFVIFCIILIFCLPQSLYVVWVHQGYWLPRSCIQVNAILWPSTWAIRVVFVVPSWLKIFHLRGFSWRIHHMLLGSLPHPHHWGVWFLRVLSICLLGCPFLILVCWCPIL